MRAIFAIHTLGLNGAVLAALRQARHMAAQGDSVTMVTPPLAGPDAELLPQFLAAGVQVARNVELATYDVAIVCTILGWETVHACAGKIPVVWWIHEGRMGVRMAGADPRIRAAFGLADKLIFPGQGIVDHYYRELLGPAPTSRAAVVPPACDPPPDIPAAAKTAGHFRIVCTGTVCPRKRQSDLVRAVAALGEAPVECILIGPVALPLDDAATAIVQAQPTRFRLTGSIGGDALHALYRSADVFALPSDDESFGMTPIEAGRHGLPVILSDLDCYEGLWRHGVSALIHPVGDLSLLVWYLRMVHEDPALRQRFGTAAANVARRFSPKRFHALFDAEIAEAIAAWRPAIPERRADAGASQSDSVAAPPPTAAPPAARAPDHQTAEREGRALLAGGAFEAAEAMVRPFLASGSGPLPLWRILASALRHQGRIRETLAIQQMLVDTLPGDLPLRFDLSETLLLLGEFERGWKEYHYRYSLPHTTILDRKVQRPTWDGSPIPGKTLLIHDEQGYGDTLQFMRMVAWAKQRSGAKVVLEINHDTASFARRMKGIDHLALRGELPPPFDVHCQMMSLPATMGLKLSDLPGTIPYLGADPARLNRWRKRLAGLPRPLVALVWAGRPSHFNDANRSASLATLAPLAMDGVTFLSVQKGPKAAEAAQPPAGMRLEDLSPKINDFDDTAAILSIADLLISVDSSPVHLAGALGRPAWVMLPLVPDWRWLLEREDTPWYPSLRLFRQSARGDWTTVMARMAQELAALRNHVRQAR